MVRISLWVGTVDSQKLEHEPGTIYASCPSSPGFGVGGQSYSSFLASTVWVSVALLGGYFYLKVQGT